MWKVIDIMLVNAAGIKTHRDHFAIDFEEESITQKFRELRETNLSNEDYSNKYNIHDHQDLRLDKVRQLIRLDTQWEDKIISCLYRPFDWRYCYYSDLIMDRPR